MALEMIVYILVGIIILQLFEIIFLLYFYNRNKNAKVAGKPIDSSSTLTRIIEDANKKAQEIVQNAVDKADEILYESTSFRTKIEKEMKFVFNDSVNTHKKSFDELLEGAISQYKSVLLDTKKVFNEQMQKTLTTMQSAAQTELQEFQSTAQKNQAFAEEYLKQKIDAEFDLAKKEIEAYKKVEMQRIHDTINIKVNDITVKVLKGSISKEKQEQLVLDALEKAKIDNVM